jgi:16S rRNA (guanine527-N7)-methyltransferase
LPFCKVGGVFIAMKKCDAGDEIDEAGEAINILGGRVKQMIRVEIEELSDRALVVIDKAKPTPEKYPRRSGIPQKRPLLRSTRGAS